MSASTLRWAWRSLLVEFLMAVRGGLANRIPFLIRCILGSCLAHGRIVALLLAVLHPADGQEVKRCCVHKELQLIHVSVIGE